jgi:hypothetical protein
MAGWVGVLIAHRTPLLGDLLIELIDTAWPGVGAGATDDPTTLLQRPGCRPRVIIVGSSIATLELMDCLGRLAPQAALVVMIDGHEQAGVTWPDVHATLGQHASRAEVVAVLDPILSRQ